MTHQFALMLALVLVVGLWVTEKCSAYPALSRRAYVIGIWGGVVGARLWYALQYAEFSVVGGWASWGFLFGASLSSVGYLRWVKGEWAFGDFADATVPALGLGGAVMRLNCYSIGCNFGRPTKLPWAVVYPSGYPAYEAQLHSGLIGPGNSYSLSIHPTQLYESVALLLALALVLWLRRRSDLLPGESFLIGILLYGLFRFLVEFIRGDAGGLHLGPLTFAQVSSLLGVATALAILAWRRVGRRRPTFPEVESID